MTELSIFLEMMKRIDQNDFIYLYGENLGNHLWSKYRKLGLEFLYYLDNDNLILLEEYINKGLPNHED